MQSNQLSDNIPGSVRNDTPNEVMRPPDMEKLKHPRRKKKPKTSPYSSSSEKKTEQNIDHNYSNTVLKTLSGNYSLSDINLIKFLESSFGKK